MSSYSSAPAPSPTRVNSGTATFPSGSWNSEVLIAPYASDNCRSPTNVLGPQGWYMLSFPM